MAEADKDQPPFSKTAEFAHNSERQFAKLLDFYQIEWEYEPRSFDIGRDKDGEVNQRFRPDFYLPTYDTYIEITTLNQKLVTKKNRKVRLLRELYPDVKCKIFYQRDYLDLLIKYGLERPSQDLTSDSLTSDSLTSDSLTSDSLTSDSLTSDSLTSDSLTSDSLTSDSQDSGPQTQVG